MAQSERGLEIGRRVRLPVSREGSARRSGERIEAKERCAIGWLHPCAFNQSGECERLLRTVAAEIKLKMRPGVETHALKSRVERRRIETPEAVAVGAERAGEHDLKTVGAAGQIVERLGVGVAGVRMVETRDNTPGAGGSKQR